MARLFSFYAPAFSFGLAIDAQPAGVAPERTAAEAQQRMRRLLERARHGALAADKPAQHVESAAFAVAAWFDEIAARQPGWNEAVAPLQLQLFNSTNAATEFFHHLANLQANDAELREVYWYALALGFKGQYYFEADAGRGALAQLKALHAAQLPLAVPDASALARKPLCPQPYAQPDPPATPRAHRRSRLALRATAALTLLALSGLLAGGLHRLAQGWPGTAHAPPLAARIEQRLQNYTCADLRVSGPRQGPLQVHGFVPDMEDMERVRQDVAAVADAAAADVQLQLRPWPYCEVSAILRPHQARNHRLRPGLRVSAPQAQGGRLHEGHRVSIEVSTPARDGLLWVDYYTADGAVIHLHARNTRRVAFGAGQTLVFGEDIPPSWLVSPPFGTVLITVVAVPASATLAPAEPAPYELASAYLQRLRATLAAVPASDPPIAELLFLQTVAQ